jgi:subtilisin family serine protease
MRSIHLISKLALSLVVPVALGAGCAVVEEDFAGAVDTTMAPLVTVDPAARIPDQYIVVFKDSIGARGMNAAMNRIELADARSRIDVQFDVIPAFSARLMPADLEAIRRNPDVAYVEPDQLVHATATRPAGPGLMIDIHDHCPIEKDGIYDDHGCNGAGALIYVVDTGIRATHTQFGGRVNTARGFTAINDGRGTTDCNGHGTHVASTAGGSTFGMASAATLVPVRVLGCTGSGSNTGVINGVNHVRNNCGASERCVANMSLGGGVSAALDSAVASAVSAGIAFAVAAGNNNQDAINFSPAREPSAITVGALSNTGYPGSTNSNSVQRASFSNFGSRVDIWAAGQAILGADDNSDTATQTISGTSMASPHVAGAIAQMLSCTGRISAAQVEANLNAKSVNDAISNEQGGEDRILCNDWIDADGNACACGGTPPPLTQCQQSSSCGGQDPAGCFCDAACVQFGDCCPGGPC